MPIRPPIPRGLPPVPSLLKWTGSKRSQAAAIFAAFPPHRRYFEPFLGGGAVLYLAAAPGSVAGDSYGPLIEFWRLVQTDVGAVIAGYAERWHALQRLGQSFFYEVRDRFNRGPNGPDLHFLMRTCVNGIIRLNDAGAFNNSFHLSRKGMRPATFAAAANTWAARIRGVAFTCESYERTLESAAARDLVYLDPPYAGNYQRYIADLDLERFWKVLEDLNRREVKWVLSFDGHRGEADLSHPVPADLYRRRRLLRSGNSAVGKVLGGKIEGVRESLYLNYET